jgi:hypothetical protein
MKELYHLAYLIKLPQRLFKIVIPKPIDKEKPDVFTSYYYSEVIKWANWRHARILDVEMRNKTNEFRVNP